MVATDAAIATRVGADVLRTGGNAVDAAIATAFALAVVFPTAGNIGGGGFMVSRVSGRSYALDFRETAPGAAKAGMYRDAEPGKDSRNGPRSAGVPGSVAGLFEAWHRLGSKRKSWQELLAPAVHLAEGGFAVDASFAKAIAYEQSRLAKDAASAAIFLPSGSAPAVGSTFRDPELASLLRRIGEEGPKAFYEGPAAEAIEAAMKAGGGLITVEDLKGYRAVWRDPIDFVYRGRHVIGMPPPSSGGVTMAMVANVLSGWDLPHLAWHSAEHVHLAAEAMRRAFLARNARLGDPDFARDPYNDLLSQQWADAERSSIRLDRATPTDDLGPAPSAGSGAGPHTTHLSIVDGEGNAVAMTTTINAWFGSAVTVPGLGFVLNDEMDDFATTPGAPNMFGLVQGEANAIEPGKRMLSSMSPTIVLGPRGDVDLVLGAAGGSRIITTVFEELSNVVDFGMAAADAVRAPRFHQQDRPDVLLLEPHAFSEGVRSALEQMGHRTKVVDHIGDSQAIGRSGSVWQGVSEPRREGSLALGP
ncbi:MAG: gamma-glutamyltransferase [Polyangiaceae bacterium]|jgi:gamma-glutamyltranspeptidase/glutathione hydrolase